MVTHPRLFRLVQKGDWFTSMDLKDMHFRIPIMQRHRKYLRFAFQDTSYKFCILPFILSLALKIFSVVVDVAVAPLHAQGIGILSICR